jgi:hypothetical protein
MELRKNSFTSIKKLLHVKRDYNINIKITLMCDVNEKFLEGPYLKQHSSSVNKGFFWLDQFSVKANDSQMLIKFQMDILMCVVLYTSSTLF